MYIRRKMYSIGYDENDLYEVEQRAFSNGFACAERLFAETLSERYGEDMDNENYFKRLWKYGFGSKAEQKERMKALKDAKLFEAMDDLANQKKYGTKDMRKKAKDALAAIIGDKSEGALTDDQKKLRRALAKTKYGKAAIIGGGALGSGALGYGAYRASQD